MTDAPARILHLEDNLWDHQFMRNCLAHGSSSSLVLHHAAGLEEAGDRVKQHQYQMVIADLNLPDGQGLETFFKVKAMAPEAAIVVMTGVDDPDLARRAVKEGAEDYLVKGELSPVRVRQSLAHALERHARLRHLNTTAFDLKKRNSSLREMAHLDPLTGMLNRRGLNHALARPNALAPGNAPHCALLVDVDDFKKVNDLFGYALGDQTLKEISQRLKILLRPGDIAARVGGDEFLLLLNGTGLRCAVQATSVGGVCRATVSVGLAALPPQVSGIGELLELTHGVLRQSKGLGKNRVCQSGAAPGPESLAPRRSPLFNLAQRTKAAHRFELPSPAGADPGDGPDPALRRLVRAAVEGGEGLECHLVLSPTQLLRLRPEHLAELCGEALAQRRLRLAVPVVPMSPLPPGLLEAVRRLQKAGWILALDGFNLAAHAMANLVLLEPSMVTLDPALVRGVWQDPERLRSLVRLCRTVTAMGAYPVAAGVDGPDELKVLRGLEIGLGWGTHLDGPAG